MSGAWTPTRPASAVAWGGWRQLGSDASGAAFAWKQCGEDDETCRTLGDQRIGAQSYHLLAPLPLDPNSRTEQNSQQEALEGFLTVDHHARLMSVRTPVLSARHLWVRRRQKEAALALRRVRRQDQDLVTAWGRRDEWGGGDELHTCIERRYGLKPRPRGRPCPSPTPSRDAGAPSAPGPR